MSADMEVGRFGLRTFGVDRDGHLLPIGPGDRFDWRDGVCIAQCKVGGLHRTPAEGCSCGIYSFTSLEALQTQYGPASHLVAVIAPEGMARIGQNGTISARARVIALWTADERLTAKVREATSTEILPYADLEAMVTDYGLRFTAELAPPEQLRPAGAVRGFAGEVARSAAGLGWGRIGHAASSALLLHLLAAGFAATSAVPMSSPVAAIADVTRALDHAVLTVGAQLVTALVGLLLAISIAGVLMQLLMQRRTGTAADGRLARHATSMTLRRVIWPLVFVAAYQGIAGQFPGWALLGWITAFALAASWAEGGTVYHLSRATTENARRRREPGPLRPQPSLHELLDAAKNRRRGGTTST